MNRNLIFSIVLATVLPALLAGCLDQAGAMTFSSCNVTEAVLVRSRVQSRMKVQMSTPAYISVASFGAVGNGSTDDTAALQAAFNYAAANGLEVYIPPGNYLHSGVLQANGIVIFGAGDSTQLTSTVAGNEALILTGTNPALYNIQMAGVATSRLTNNDSAQVLVQYASGFTVENVNVLSSSSVGIFTVDSTNGNILHNTVQGTLADGIYTTVASSNINIENNLTIDTGDDAISVSSYAGDPGYTHNIVISNNTVTGNWQSRSITVNGGYGITISQNYIDGGTAGIAVGSESEWGTRNVYDVTVTGNTILNTTYTGEGTIGGGAISLYSDVGATGLTITGNTIYSPAHDGIFIDGTSQIQATITGNQIFATSSNPTYVNKDASATEILQSSNPELAPSAYVVSAPPAGNGVDPALQLPIANPASTAPASTTTTSPTKSGGTGNPIHHNSMQFIYGGSTGAAVTATAQTQAPATVATSGLQATSTLSTMVSATEVNAPPVTTLVADDPATPGISAGPLINVGVSGWVPLFAALVARGGVAGWHSSTVIH